MTLLKTIGDVAGGAAKGIGGFLSGFAWKIGTFAGAAGCVVLTGYLIAARVEVSHLNTENAGLHKLIEDPKTGYMAQLAQCRTNTVTMDQAVKMQNDAVAAQSARDAAALKAAEIALTAAQGRIQGLQDRAAVTLAYQPKGASTCEKTQDVISNYLERLQ